MPNIGSKRTRYIALDERDPGDIRCVILARSSDPSAKREDMSAQVEQAQDFITQMGWRLVADAYAYCEAASGMRQVARPVLDDVLKLAIRGEIDIIVCKSMERIARTKGRRFQAIQTALDHGVEFRFCEFAEHNGKVPDDRGMKMWLAFKEEFGEFEAEQIADRLGPAKRRRYEDGLPHGGRNGPNWGYAPGERRLGRHGKPLGLISWIIDETKAPDVRWLFETVAATQPQDFSLRALTMP